VRYFSNLLSRSNVDLASNSQMDAHGVTILMNKRSKAQEPKAGCAWQKRASSKRAKKK